MVLFIACLMGQFVPGEAQSPTFGEFKAICQELKQQQITDERSALELMKPSPNQVVQPPRTEKQRILKTIQEKVAQLKKIEKDETLLPVPQLIVQSMQVGHMGELFSRVIYTAVPATGEPDNKTSVERIETTPANLTVLKSYRPKAIVCTCDKTEFVLLHYRGPAPANGEIVKPQGIYRVSGQYKVAGKTLLAIEQWEHNSDWQKRIRRPEPAGKIEIATQPGERKPVSGTQQ